MFWTLLFLWKIQGLVPERGQGGEYLAVAPSSVDEKFYAFRGIFNGKLCFYAQKDTLYSVF